MLFEEPDFQAIDRRDWYAGLAMLALVNAGKLLPEQPGDTPHTTEPNQILAIQAWQLAKEMCFHRAALEAEEAVIQAQGRVRE